MNPADENWLLEIRNRYQNDRFLYEVFERQVYKEALKYNGNRINTVLDIGARYGEFSFYMYPISSQIYAVEPEVRNFGELKFNIELHKLNKIKYFDFALSNTNATAPLRITGDTGGHSLVDEQPHDFIIVPTKTLKTFMEEQKIEHIDVLKIDIEGGEKRVFMDEEFREIAPKIDFIIGEHAGGGVSDRLVETGFKYEVKGEVFIAQR